MSTTNTTHCPIPASVHALRQLPLRSLATTSQCPLTRALATEKLSALVREENRQRVTLSLARDAAHRSTSNTHPVPIKCGLRNAAGTPGFVAQEHWFFDRLTEKEAKRLQRVINEWNSTFGTSIERPLALSLANAGKNLKAALTVWNLQVFLEVPEEVRKGPHALKIKEVIVKKVQGAL